MTMPLPPGRVRPLLRWPDQRLRQAAAAVGTPDDEARAVWADLLDTMAGMPANVGLAAPQIGVLRALAVVDAGPDGPFGKAGPLCLADPEITWEDPALASHDEASPNLPGVAATVMRPAAVRVVYTDLHGQRVEAVFRSLWAASVQHQIDHLQGRMFFDRLGAVKRRMVLARAARIARQGRG